MKVLLVDDEPHIRKIGQLTLQAVARWQVLLASSGAEALDLALRHEPDLILLDVMMPDMDGPATLRRLRENRATATLPVIFLSANAQQHQVDEYLSLGAMGIIAKPFDPMLLPDQILGILERPAGASRS